MTDVSGVNKKWFSLTFNILELSKQVDLKIIIFLNSLKENLLALNQSIKDFSSLLMKWEMSDRSLFPFNKLLSSAKGWMMQLSRVFKRSFTNSRNGGGPKVDYCRTSYLIFFWFEKRNL